MCVIAGARVDSARNIAQVRRPNIATQKSSGRKARSGAGGRRDGSGVHYRGRSGDVQEHIVIGWIIGDPKATANHRLIPFHAKKTWIVGESDVRTEIFIVIGDLRKSSNRGWQRRIPERGRTRLVCNA